MQAARASLAASRASVSGFRPGAGAGAGAIGPTISSNQLQYNAVAGAAASGVPLMRASQYGAAVAGPRGTSLYGIAGAGGAGGGGGGHIGSLIVDDLLGPSDILMGDLAAAAAGGGGGRAGGAGGGGGGAGLHSLNNSLLLVLPEHTSPRASTVLPPGMSLGVGAPLQFQGGGGAGAPSHVADFGRGPPHRMTGGTGSSAGVGVSVGAGASSIAGVGIGGAGRKPRRSSAIVFSSMLGNDDFLQLLEAAGNNDGRPEGVIEVQDVPGRHPMAAASVGGMGSSSARFRNGYASEEQPHLVVVGAGSNTHLPAVIASAAAATAAALVAAAGGSPFSTAAHPAAAGAAGGVGASGRLGGCSGSNSHNQLPSTASGSLALPSAASAVLPAGALPAHRSRPASAMTFGTSTAAGSGTAGSGVHGSGPMAAVGAMGGSGRVMRAHGAAATVGGYVGSSTSVPIDVGGCGSGVGAGGEAGFVQCSAGSPHGGSAVPLCREQGRNGGGSASHSGMIQPAAATDGVVLARGGPSGPAGLLATLMQASYIAHQGGSSTVASATGTEQQALLPTDAAAAPGSRGRSHEQERTALLMALAAPPPTLMPGGAAGAAAPSPARSTPQPSSPNGMSWITSVPEDEPHEPEAAATAATAAAAAAAAAASEERRASASCHTDASAVAVAATPPLGAALASIGGSLRRAASAKGVRGGPAVEASRAADAASAASTGTGAGTGAEGAGAAPAVAAAAAPVTRSGEAGPHARSGASGWFVGSGAYTGASVDGAVLCGPPAALAGTRLTRSVTEAPGRGGGGGGGGASAFGSTAVVPAAVITTPAAVAAAAASASARQPAAGPRSPLSTAMTAPTPEDASDVGAGPCQAPVSGNPDGNEEMIAGAAVTAAQLRRSSMLGASGVVATTTADGGGVSGGLLGGAGSLPSELMQPQGSGPGSEPAPSNAGVARAARRLSCLSPGDAVAALVPPRLGYAAAASGGVSPPSPLAWRTSRPSPALATDVGGGGGVAGGPPSHWPSYLGTYVDSPRASPGEQQCPPASEGGRQPDAPSSPRGAPSGRRSQSVQGYTLDMTGDGNATATAAAVAAAMAAGSGGGAGGIGGVSGSTAVTSPFVPPSPAADAEQSILDSFDPSSALATSASASATPRAGRAPPRRRPSLLRTLLSSTSNMSAVAGVAVGGSAGAAAGSAAGPATGPAGGSSSGGPSNSGGAGSAGSSGNISTSGMGAAGDLPSTHSAGAGGGAGGVAGASTAAAGRAPVRRPPKRVVSELPRRASLLVASGGSFIVAAGSLLGLAGGGGGATTAAAAGGAPGIARSSIVSIGVGAGGGSARTTQELLGWERGAAVNGSFVAVGSPRGSPVASRQASMVGRRNVPRRDSVLGPLIAELVCDGSLAETASALGLALASAGSGAYGGGHTSGGGGGAAVGGGGGGAGGGSAGIGAGTGSITSGGAGGYTSMHNFSTGSGHAMGHGGGGGGGATGTGGGGGGGGTGFTSPFINTLERSDPHAPEGILSWERPAGWDDPPTGGTGTTGGGGGGSLLARSNFAAAASRESGMSAAAIAAALPSVIIDHGPVGPPHHQHQHF
eukprot:XP_001697218.1 predicted protein [Chlamydomonas reinhardtii]